MIESKKKPKISKNTEKTIEGENQRKTKKKSLNIKEKKTAKRRKNESKLNYSNAWPSQLVSNSNNHCIKIIA